MQIGGLPEVIRHPISPPDLKLFCWVDRESLGLLSTVPLLSFNQKNGHEIHLDRDSHRILFAQQSNSEAVKSQVFYSSNVIPGHSRFFSEVPRYITPLAKQHPHTTARPFPGAASWHLRY